MHSAFGILHSAFRITSGRVCGCEIERFADTSTPSEAWSRTQSVDFVFCKPYRFLPAVEMTKRESK